MVYPSPVDKDLGPPASISAYQRVIAAFDNLIRVKRPGSWLTLRCPEDVLTDARTIDRRIRAGEQLPLAGVLVAAPDTALLPQRLTEAGAVLLGTVDPALPGNAVQLDTVDVVIAASPPESCRNLVGLTPTRGLVPMMDTITVLAGNIDIAQRTASALTGPDETDPRSRSWPAWARLSAGQHPRILVPEQRDQALLPGRSRASLATITETLLATQAAVEDACLAEVIDSWAERPARALGDHDALLIPMNGVRPDLTRLLADLDAAAVMLPDSGPSGIGVLTKAFHDQVAIDLAALLTGVPAETPYPTVGVDLVVFGEYLRGQPRHSDLAKLGARYTGFAQTAPRYRMVALPGTPMQAGVIDADGGAALLAERWLISPAGMNEFLADLPAPLTMGTVELDDGTQVTGTLCDPAAAVRGTDVTDFGCWRAYLRHLSTQRPVARPALG